MSSFGNRSWLRYSSRPSRWRCSTTCFSTASSKGSQEEHSGRESSRKEGSPVAEPTNGLESSTLTRGDLLKRGGAAAFTVTMFGALSDRALGFYGPLKFAHKQLAGDLRIMTWAHFVPSYDQWL